MYMSSPCPTTGVVGNLRPPPPREQFLCGPSAPLLRGKKNINEYYVMCLSCGCSLYMTKITTHFRPAVVKRLPTTVWHLMYQFLFKGWGYCQVSGAWYQNRPYFLERVASLTALSTTDFQEGPLIIRSLTIL